MLRISSFYWTCIAPARSISEPFEFPWNLLSHSLRNTEYISAQLNICFIMKWRLSMLQTSWEWEILDEIMLICKFHFYRSCKNWGEPTVGKTFRARCNLRQQKWQRENFLKCTHKVIFFDISSLFFAEVFLLRIKQVLNNFIFCHHARFIAYINAWI